RVDELPVRRAEARRGQVELAGEKQAACRISRAHELVRVEGGRAVRAARRIPRADHRSGSVGDHEDRACEPSCRAPTTRMRRSRWWMRYSNRHPPSVSSALAECASLNALVGEMLSILAVSSKTSNARKSKSAGASISAAK